MTKKAEYVTKGILQKTLDTALKKALQKQEESILSKVFAKFALRTDLEEVKERLARLETKFDAGFANLDTYLKRSELWHDEHVLLRASHQRLKNVLVQKGVVSDSELAI